MFCVMSDTVGRPLVAVGLERRFDDGERVIHVLRGLDLALERGESVAVVGQSGVGKSTLLHLLGALDRADAGSVNVNGQDLYAMNPSELSKARSLDIGFVFQFHHLLGDFDAIENVMLPLAISGMGRGAARKRAQTMLERVGLAKRMDHRPGQLSGGEQQRVAVARALVARPRVILADEPTGNLDPSTAEAVQLLLMDLQREHECAMIVATHSAALATAMDRTVRMEDGVLHEERRG